MFESLWSMVTAQLAAAMQNDFLSGGVVLMLLGSVLALCRQLPRRVVDLVWRQGTVSVEVMSHDIAYEWLKVWLDKQTYAREARRLSASATRGMQGSEKCHVTLTPAPGNHFFFYRGRLLWLSRSRKDGNSKQTDDTNWSSMLVPQETMTITVLGRKQDAARQLLEEAYRLYATNLQDAASLYTSQGSSWYQQGPVKGRPLESVILPGTQREDLVADLQQFLGAEAWYRERGIPYRRGYLLEGVPGAGKSSIVKALAGHLGLNLYVLNLGNATMSDDRLTELMSYLRERSILLIEDIDAALRNRARDDAGSTGADKQGVTLSGLLNALDGVATMDGLVTIMTTNYADRLDAALVRPGRADVRLQFENATLDQLERLYARFYALPADDRRVGEFARIVGDRRVSMAAVQDHLLRHRADPAAALARVADIRGFAGPGEVCRVGALDSPYADA